MSDPSPWPPPSPPDRPDIVFEVVHPEDLARPPWAPPPVRERYWVHAALLLLTVLTTTAAGAMHWLSFQADFQDQVPNIPMVSVALNGLWYGLTILAILGAHELGHYLACRYYGISASLPYFLPVPLPLTGTAGAFIRIRQPITTKPALFDIGIAGPIAGFVVAVPALFVGLSLSRVVELPAEFTGLSLGEPLLFKGAAWLVWGPVADNQSINLHPMAFAAWFGLLATVLNLFPIGQLDGGHIAYAALGRRAFMVTVGTVGAAIGLCFYSSSWIVWTAVAVGLLFAFGWRHPRTWDEDVPLDRTRLWLAIVAIVIFALCFTPAPIEPLDLIQPK